MVSVISASRADGPEEEKAEKEAAGKRSHQITPEGKGHLRR
jgi:hypothetical protein